MTASSDQAPVIYWFRQDLRLQDLPGLAAALASGRPVLPCYILDDDSPGHWRMGGASRWWLHHSLAALAAKIEALGGHLYLGRGQPAALLAQLAQDSGAQLVCCSRQYEPWARELEQQVHSALDERGITLKRFAGSLLWEPEQVQNQAGLPFKVYTPFWRKCRTLPVAGRAAPEVTFGRWPAACGNGDPLATWDLLPSQPDWASHWQTLWTPGEDGAQARLNDFLQQAVADYTQLRDYPARQATSGLSAHLHFGELAPAAVYHAALERARGLPAIETAVEKFVSELAWREFSYHLLYHFPSFPEEPYKPKFAAFPWLGGAAQLHAWQKGRTGYPIVDAGMRELWQTGYMQNRVRMVTASFLCKHLLVDWRAGQRWFWDTLVDADLANNACGWQWVAGSGADASPYFRIFNPTTQGEKFDKAGDYVRRWIPELAELPDRYLHQPWSAPADVLRDAHVTLGETYPHPIVDHREARNAALAAYAHISESSRD